MKIIYKKIRSCSECPYSCVPDSSDCNMDCFCMKCETKYFRQTKTKKFPEWCPLEDVPRPDKAYADSWGFT